MIAHTTKKEINNNSNRLKYQYKINITQALSKMKDTIVILFNRPYFVVKELLEKLRNIFIKTVEPIRPGRRFPRKHKHQRKGFYVCYKPIR